MYISEKQKKTLRDIKTLGRWRGERIQFTQAEIPNLTQHTIKALIEKGFLEEIDGPFGMLSRINYYKWTGKELE
jgi:hypothetical protein